MTERDGFAIPGKWFSKKYSHIKDLNKAVVPIKYLIVVRLDGFEFSDFGPTDHVIDNRSAAT